MTDGDGFVSMIVQERIKIIKTTIRKKNITQTLFNFCSSYKSKNDEINKMIIKEMFFFN